MALVDVETEDARNRRLRRADWRFLLPDPSPRKSICFAGGLLAEAVRSISEEWCDPRSDDRNCDLAVAVDPDARTLARAAAALRGGGWCYTEWYRAARTPRAIRRRLHAAGFTEVTCYWPRLDPAERPASVWSPIGAVGALDHLLTSRPPVTPRDRPIQLALRRWSWRLRPSLGLARPLVAVARVGRPPHDPPTPRAGESECPQPRAGSERVSTLLLTGGGRSISKAVALHFCEPDRRPRIAVKMSRTPESTRGLAAEAANLRRLAERLGAVPGVPTVRFVRCYRGGLAVGESAMSGTPVDAILDRSNYRVLALKAVDWLARLAAGAPAEPPAERWRRVIEPVLADFDAHFGDVVDRGAFNATVVAVRCLDAAPVVYEQRDFSPWNVHVIPGGELAIFDWESAEPDGLPLLDLVYFLTYAAFALDGAHPREPQTLCASYRATLDASTFTGAVSAECVARYASRVGLEERLVRPLRLLTWLVHSRSDYRHMQADAGERPGRDVLRRSVFLTLWREELRRA